VRLDPVPDPRPAPSEPFVCSARGCRAAAEWALRWNNPRLHTPDRRKVWLACDEHRTSLADFLSLRSFLVDVVPVAELPAQVRAELRPEHP
jgi:hypothetical protein